MHRPDQLDAGRQRRQDALAAVEAIDQKQQLAVGQSRGDRSVNPVICSGLF